jgi:thiamine biosynthesis lipoprotein
MIFDPLALPAIEALAEQRGQYQFRDEAVLGTRLGLTISASNGDVALVAARTARAEIDRLNLVFNSRLRSSELFALNTTNEHRASADLFAAIEAAERWRVTSDGAFSPRLGRVLDHWRGAGAALPDRARAKRLAEAATARVEMDPATRTIIRPDMVRFALDGFAKGWIVDAALKAMLACEGVSGALVDIGGDIACGGVPPEGGWTIDIPDPLLPFDNAPVVTSVSLTGGGIATSGRGPRDRTIDGQRLSPTLSPRNGWSIEHRVSASAIAGSAADADALATALMVLPQDDALKLIARLPGTGARLSAPDGAAVAAGIWQSLEQPAPVRIQSGGGAWFKGWQALATFTAPRRQLIRDPDFRSPYMAMWITDANNRPVRTLILVGKREEWQRDNYIWWQLNRAATGRLISTRSMSTSGAGVYNVFWDGVDDRGAPVAPATYILHVETSRERGKHTYRQLSLDFTRAERFNRVLEPTEEGGGLKVTFDHY